MAIPAWTAGSTLMPGDFIGTIAMPKFADPSSHAAISGAAAASRSGQGQASADGISWPPFVRHSQNRLWLLRQISRDWLFRRHPAGRGWLDGSYPALHRNRPPPSKRARGPLARATPKGIARPKAPTMRSARGPFGGRLLTFGNFPAIPIHRQHARRF